MARKNNFLLGFGERLTGRVEVPTGGGDKNPPYTFPEARSRVEQWLTASVVSFDSLAADAAPNDEVVAIMAFILDTYPRATSHESFLRPRGSGPWGAGSRESSLNNGAWRNILRRPIPKHSM